jgi:hypothetical protein
MSKGYDISELSKLEHRTYRLVADDGLADIMLGAFLLFFGLALARSLPYAGLLGGALGALALSAWRPLRKRVVEPRVGYVRLTEGRAARIRLAQCLAALAMVLVIAAALWFTDGGRAADTWLPGLAFAGPVVIVGYIADLGRWYFYAAVMMGERFIDSLSGGPVDWLFWPSGAVVAVAGAVVLVCFLQRYPRGRGDDAQAT